MKIKIIYLTTIIVLLLNKFSLGQDTIFKQNKEVVIAKIIEISPTEVKYKLFENINGPLYTTSKSEISKIKYLNGMIDDFNLEKKQEKSHEMKINQAAVDLTPRYILTMNDGTQIRGKIVSENAKEIVFSGNNIGEKTISRSKIKKLELEFGEVIRVFTLTDGSVITGKIVNKSETYTAIETKDLGIINIPEEKIKNIRDFEDATITEGGKIWFKNPNCTRYLFAPSAIPLKKGEGYYQNIYGAGNSAQFGLSNNVTVGVGLVGPLGVYLDAKVGVKLGEYVHLAGGALLGNGFFPVDGDNFGLGIGFGVLTIGNYDHNITVGAGYGFMNKSGSTGMMEKPFYTANGMARLGKKYALVTENWVVNVQGDPFGRNISAKSHYETFFSYAFRYMGQKSTLDAGFINTPTLIENGWFIGIPYIGFVIRFGNYKDE